MLASGIKELTLKDDAEDNTEDDASVLTSSSSE